MYLISYDQEIVGAALCVAMLGLYMQKLYLRESCSYTLQDLDYRHAFITAVRLSRAACGGICLPLKNRSQDLEYLPFTCREHHPLRAE
jgi:hypothetical protein